MHRTPSQRRGFTLSEVIIAVGIFSVVAVANFALFDLVLKDIKQVTHRDETIRGASAFQDTLRQAKFETAFDWVKKDQELFAYHYRAHLSNTRADGSPAPYTGTGMIGTDYRVVPALRAKTDPFLAADTAVKEGGLYRVRLSLSKSNPLDTLPATALEYKDPILVVLAKFHDAGNIASVQAAGDKPLHTSTLSYLK